MHVVMVSVGSWGDAEPYLALAQELLSSTSTNIKVDFFVQEDYKTRVQEMTCHDKHENPFGNNNFRLFGLPFATRDFYKVQTKKKKQDPVDPKLRHVATVGEIMGELVLPCADWMHSIILSSDDSQKIILSSALSRPLCWLLAQVLEIPLILLHLQPVAPNVLFPLYSVSKDRCVRAILEVSQTHQLPNENNNEIDESYWKIVEALDQGFLKDRLQAAFSNFGLDPPSWIELQAMLRGEDPMVHIANCFSNFLIQKIVGTPGLGPNIHEIGPLADSFLSWNYESSPELDAFLESCHERRPICIGFGSMPFSELSAIMDALMELDAPAVLLGAPFQFRSCPPKYQKFIFDSNKIFRIGFASYAHLLPQCSMMLCHGGAGVVHATIRAGIPCLIRPIMGDQFLFASLLEEKGFGMQVGSSSSPLQAHDIVTAVRHVQSDSSGIVANCRQLRQRILEEETSGMNPHGTVKLANLLKRIIQQQKRCPKENN